MRRFPAILALVLSIGACSSGTPSGTPRSLDPSATPTTSPSGSATAKGTDEPKGSIPSGDAPAPSQSVVAAPPPEQPATEPARPGTYRYKQEGKQTFGGLEMSFDPVGIYEVSKATGSGNDRKQKTMRRYSSSRSRETTVAYRSDAILLVEVVERISFGTSEREFRCKTAKPIPLLPIPWKVGGTWSGGGACNGFTASYEAKLREVDQYAIDGTTIRVLVIEATATVKGDGLQQESEITMRLSPDHRMIVHAVEHSEGTLNGTPFTRDLTETLETLRPA
jgi:hypothetical protein